MLEAMNTKTTLQLIAAAGLSLGLATTATAGTIANWKQLNVGSSAVVSGQNTDSPTFGDGSANNADNAWIAGRFGTVGTPETVNLAEGDVLTVTGTITLTGGSTANGNFRLGVHDDGGQFALDGTTWSNGGWIVRDDNGFYQARTDGAFVSTNADAVQLADTQTDTGGSFTGNSAAAYDWTLTVTRDSATTVDLFASLTGGDNAVNRTYQIDDVNTSVFTYTAVSVLLGGNLDVDQAEFSNFQFSVVPEPSSLALLALGGLALARRRRRA